MSIFFENEDTFLQKYPFLKNLLTDLKKQLNIQGYSINCFNQQDQNTKCFLISSKTNNFIFSPVAFFIDTKLKNENKTYSQNFIFSFLGESFDYFLKNVFLDQNEEMISFYYEQDKILKHMKQLRNFHLHHSKDFMSFFKTEIEKYKTENNIDYEINGLTTYNENLHELTSQDLFFIRNQFTNILLNKLINFNQSDFLKFHNDCAENSLFIYNKQVEEIKYNLAIFFKHFIDINEENKKQLILKSIEEHFPDNKLLI